VKPIYGLGEANRARQTGRVVTVSPFSGRTSERPDRVFGERAGLVEPKLVKSVNSLQTVNVRRFLSDEVVIARSLDEIFQPISAHSSIQNLVNHIFFLVIDYYERGWRILLSGERIIDHGAQERDMLHRVHSNVSREIQLVDSVEDDFDDDEELETSMIELAARTISRHVLRT
jgi:hypothetical protein